VKKHNPENERIKRKYFAYLKEAKRHSESTVDAVAKALSRFAVYTTYRSFKAFHFQQAIGFKRALAEQHGAYSGQKLSKATLYATLNQLKRFFQWLADQPGYKSKLQYCEAEYFNLSDKDASIAKARRERVPATMAQVKHVLTVMPSRTEVDRRNRALIAFTLLTGARDRAITSFKLKHVDLNAGCIHQDARDVKTKFSKSFDTFFFPVGEDVRVIFVDWVRYLETVKIWGSDDPLFPATQTSVGANRQFEVSGLTRDHWTTASPIRSIFRDAFVNAGLPYFHPHSFRHTLVAFGLDTCQSPEFQGLESKSRTRESSHDLCELWRGGLPSARRNNERVG